MAIGCVYVETLGTVLLVLGLALLSDTEPFFHVSLRWSLRLIASGILILIATQILGWAINLSGREPP